jgi:hypothetical protein
LESKELLSFELSEFFGIGFEKRFSGGRHVVFHKPFSNWVIQLFVRAGFGVTILFFEYDSVRDRYLRIYKASTELGHCQKALDRMLSAVAKVESLQIRLSRKYDLSVLSNLHGLKYLHIGSRLKHPIDLSANQKLETLSMSRSVASQITGLTKLTNLTTVEAESVSQEFLGQLPKSIRSLAMSGWVTAGLNSKNLANVQKLSFDSLGKVEFGSLKPMPRIEHLSLRGVTEIKNPKGLKNTFPNLQVLSIEDADLMVRRILMDNLPAGCQVLQNITPEAAARLESM